MRLAVPTRSVKARGVAQRAVRYPLGRPSRMSRSCRAVVVAAPPSLYKPPARRRPTRPRAALPQTSHVRGASPAPHVRRTRRLAGSDMFDHESISRRVPAPNGARSPTSHTSHDSTPDSRSRTQGARGHRRRTRTHRTTHRCRSRDRFTRWRAHPREALATACRAAHHDLFASTSRPSHTERRTVRIRTRLNLRTPQNVISPSPWWHLTAPKRLTRSVLSPKSPPDFEV